MRKSLLAGLAAAALLGAPGLAVAQELDHGEAWVSLGFLTVPGSPLVSFDISWVDNNLNMYLLADRSNAAVDVFHIQVNPTVNQIKPTGANAFSGNVPSCPIANACNGPNGILTLINPTSTTTELWAGDGPTSPGNSVCATTCSTVKVFNSTAVLTHVISTGGSFRADELCFAPPNAAAGRPNGLVLIANDADAPPFISLIPTDGPNAYTVVQQIQFPQATNGIEQCQWDPNAQLFFLNIPEVNGPGDDTVAGAVFVINPNVGAITATNPAVLVPGPDAGGFPIDITQCAGPQGMAIGPVGRILLGCNAPTNTIAGIRSSVVISDAIPPTLIATLVGQGGSDQVWFDPPAFHYYLANGSLLPAQQLGITDAITNDQDQNLFIGFTGSTTRRAHSVAGWTGLNVSAVFLPIPAVGGSATAPFTSTVCGGSAAQGCIAIFATSPPTGPEPTD